jgi:hypothetical protein
MMTLDQSLKELVIAGKITRESALARSSNPKLFEQGIAPAGEAMPPRPRPKSPVVVVGSTPAAR